MFYVDMAQVYPDFGLKNLYNLDHRTVFFRLQTNRGVKITNFRILTFKQIENRLSIDPAQ